MLNWPGIPRTYSRTHNFLNSSFRLLIYVLIFFVLMLPPFYFFWPPFFQYILYFYNLLYFTWHGRKSYRYYLFILQIFVAALFSIISVNLSNNIWLYLRGILNIQFKRVYKHRIYKIPFVNVKLNLFFYRLFFFREVLFRWNFTRMAPLKLI